MKTISWKDIEKQNKKNCFVDDLELENEKLKQQLAEKDKEKEQLKEELLVAKTWLKRTLPEDYAEIEILQNVHKDDYVKFVLDDFYVINERKIRHEICEKIRNLFMERLMGKKWEDTIYISKVCMMINSVIDQIKNGEE